MICLSSFQIISGEWRIANAPLLTRWAKDVSPDNCHREYPRPTMVRSNWMNLNGLWDYAITPTNSVSPDKFEGQILVPFPIESALSGVMKRLDEKSLLWYRRKCEIPSSWNGKRVLLHFGAVDWETVVYVNGKEIGKHRGGYDGFSFDITPALKPAGEQEIVVRVFDPTQAGQPRGKQARKPEGVFYTPTSGIWQTVWIESVSDDYIQSLKIIPAFDDSAVSVKTDIVKANGDIELRIDVLDKGDVISSGTLTIKAADKKFISPTIILPMDKFKPWTLESPYLYELKIQLARNGKIVDEVSSYFGMRKVSIGQDERGITRILLNNKYVFQIGFLDQGFWPDGIYTAPTDDALKFDIEITKKMGMNLLRKHLKVEPERWYYWCDKLGLLVWQDMPLADNYTDENKKQYETELKRMIESRFNHPSIIMWVVFNEGHGQFDTERLVQTVKRLDHTRLVNSASGWDNKNFGDVIDIHNYPGPGSPAPETNRAAVLGEYGGLGLKIAGHLWSDTGWGYQGVLTRASLTRRYVELLEKVYELRDNPGLSAAVYTQITDVETECNGLLTYDREVIKPDITIVSNANRGIFPPSAKITHIQVTSEKEPQEWKYTFEKPSDDWFKPDYDDSKWQIGQGGFGTKGTPGAVVRTIWNTSDIWLRKEFILDEIDINDLYLVIHHDEDVEVYINGVIAARLKGHTVRYIDEDMTDESKKALRKGKNIIAVHCHQTAGGQYIDAGIARIVR
ncbi:MAG: sugar-binding domain-containing protein [Verrucomicrobiia bacterium]